MPVKRKSKPVNRSVKSMARRRSVKTANMQTKARATTKVNRPKTERGKAMPLAAIRYNASANRPRSGGTSGSRRTNMPATDLVPQWNLFRNIGEAIERATGGK